MPDSASHNDALGPQSTSSHLVRGDLDDVASLLAATAAEVRRHGVVLDRLRSTAELHEAGDHDGSGRSAFIVAMDGQPYVTERDALAFWVHGVLLPTYGREVSPARPWCDLWYDHPEAVARLHALWLAWKELTSEGAGLLGPSIWHRDHLDPALVQLRAPEGPFAACTTHAARPNHRLLSPPEVRKADAAP